MDPDYYSPAEAAYLSRFTTSRRIASYGLLSILFLPIIIPIGAYETWRARSVAAEPRPS